MWPLANSIGNIIQILTMVFKHCRSLRNELPQNAWLSRFSIESKFACIPNKSIHLVFPSNLATRRALQKDWTKTNVEQFVFSSKGVGPHVSLFTRLGHHHKHWINIRSIWFSVDPFYFSEHLDASRFMSFGISKCRNWPQKAKHELDVCRISPWRT